MYIYIFKFSSSYQRYVWPFCFCLLTDSFLKLFPLFYALSISPFVRFFPFAYKHDYILETNNKLNTSVQSFSIVTLPSHIATAIPPISCFPFYLYFSKRKCGHSVSTSLSFFFLNSLWSEAHSQAPLELLFSRLMITSNGQSKEHFLPSSYLISYQHCSNCPFSPFF